MPPTGGEAMIKDAARYLQSYTLPNQPQNASSSPQQGGSATTGNSSAPSGGGETASPPAQPYWGHLDHIRHGHRRVPASLQQPVGDQPASSLSKHGSGAATGKSSAASGGGETTSAPAQGYWGHLDHIRHGHRRVPAASLQQSRAAAPPLQQPVGRQPNPSESPQQASHLPATLLPPQQGDGATRQPQRPTSEQPAPSPSPHNSEVGAPSALSGNLPGPEKAGPATPTGGEAMLREVSLNFGTPRDAIRTWLDKAPALQQGDDTLDQPQQSGSENTAAPSPFNTTIEASSTVGTLVYAADPRWQPTLDQETSAFVASGVEASESYRFTPELTADVHAAGGNTYFFNVWQGSVSNIGAGSEVSFKTPQLRLGNQHALSASASISYNVTYFSFDPKDLALIRDANFRASASYTFNGTDTTAKLSTSLFRRDGDPSNSSANFSSIDNRADITQPLGNEWVVTGGVAKRYSDYEGRPRLDEFLDTSLGIEKTVKIEKTGENGEKETVATMRFSGTVGQQWRDTNMPGTNPPGDPNGPGEIVYGRQYNRVYSSFGFKITY